MGLPEQAGVRVPAEAISFCTLVNDLIEYNELTQERKTSFVMYDVWADASQNFASQFDGSSLQRLTGIGNVAINDDSLKLRFNDSIRIN